MECSLPDSSVHGIFQTRILEWVAISFSMCHDWDHQNTLLITNLNTDDLEPALSANIVSGPTCHTCMWQYSSDTDTEVGLIMYKCQMLGNTPVFLVGLCALFWNYT